jgi:hypothetical protein
MRTKEEIDPLEKAGFLFDDIDSRIMIVYKYELIAMSTQLLTKQAKKRSLPGRGACGRE